MNLIRNCAVVFAFVITCASWSATTAENIANVGCFEEPVMPVASPVEEESQYVEALLQAYSSDFSSAKLKALTDWAEAHPDSAWTPSLLYNAGEAYYKDGFFSKAIDAWKNGWAYGRKYSQADARRIADASYGELARMYASLGRMKELEELLADRGPQTPMGPGAIVADHAADGLSVMKSNPGIAFKCGPFAVASVRKALNLPEAVHQTLVDAQSTSAGFSLKQVEDFANNLGMNFKAVKRENLALDVPVPSIVHWQLNHYAAVVKKSGNRYLLQDPTFGSELWVKKEAIDTESSNYFVMPAGAIVNGFRIVPPEEASQIFGRGYNSSSDTCATGQCDGKTGGSAMRCTDCGGGNKGTSGGGGTGNGGGGAKGGLTGGAENNITTQANGFMPRYTFHSMLASLSINDVPVGYTPNYGPPSYLSLTYNQREYGQPATFNFSNFGQRWNFNWLSYVEDNPSIVNDPNFTSGQAAGAAKVYTPGGGSEEHTSWNYSTNTYEKCRLGAAKLVRTSTTPVYERVLRDGTKFIYSKVETNTPTFRRILMTSIVDPQNHAITINYDSSNRITSVVDAQQRATTFCYTSDCSATTDKKIRKVTDPYGRSASFGYDSNGRLNSITDIINLTTTFSYDGADFITTMSTPYGTTTFEKEPYGIAPTDQVRWVTATDPLGDTEKIEYIKSDYPGLSHNLPQSELPAYGTVNTANWHMAGHFSMYWSKQAMKMGPCTFENAVVTKFLNVPGEPKTGRSIDWNKQPLEGRVFYAYPNQGSNSDEGSLNSPSGIARVLDDGRTQYTKIDYNSIGHPTDIIDPAGRHTIYEYDSTGQHIRYIKQITKDSNNNPVPVTLGEVIYGNGTSEPPTSYKDAAGQVYNMQYNSFDQLTSIEDPNHQTVTYDYTTTGLLHRKNSPDPYRYIEFTYDEYDRVASATMFPDAYTLRYEYDNGDRLTKVTYPDNTYEEQKWDKLGVVASRDRLGRWTQMRYSLLGQIESVTNPAGETIQYAWCTCGSLSRVVDAEGKITAYTRDVAGRLVKEELPDHSVTTYSYQPLGGKLQSKTDPKGQVHHIAYHPDGSIFKTWTTNVAAGTAGVSEVEYAWHPEFKRLTEWHDNLGTTTLSYVPYNNSDSIYGDGKLLSTTTPWSGDVITNAYDNLGRRISQSIGGNQYFNLVQYDSDGRVTSSTNNLGTSLYSYAPHTGRVVGVSNSYQNTYFGYENGLKDFALKSIDAPLPFGDGGKYFDYEQDVVGRITKWSKGIYGEEGNENELSASYDNADRLLSLVSASGWDGLKGRWDWRISKAENRLNSQTEKFVEGESTFLQRQSYTTNDGDQLVTVASGGPLHIAGQLNEQGKINTGLQSSPVPTAPDGKFSSWINTSQLASATFSVEDFKGNGRNVTVNATSAVPAPAYAFEYDANGNTTRMITTETDGVTTSEITYEWDARDQLVAINIGQHRSEFSYDGVGRRIRIKEFQNNFVQSDKCYLWNNLKIIASGEHATPGVNSAQKKYFANGFINYGTPWYYTKDHLGSIVIASNGYDDDTNINYDPYGVPGLTGEFADEIDFLYTGHFYHRNSGLYLAPHRI